MRDLTTVAVVASLLLAGCDLAHHDEPYPGKTPKHIELEGEIDVPPPPFTDGIFPCTNCHDPEIEPNTERRVLELAHDDIVLEHDEEHRWCHDCHSAENFDKLHLASGELIDFTESYRLCGQCHGDKYRDWKAGVHGLRTGQWDGEKGYRLCVHCHNSHSPAFRLSYVPGYGPDAEKSNRPEPPPVRPEHLADRPADGGQK